jgi:hypothetical protein
MAETKTQVFTLLELNLDSPSRIQSALTALARRLPSGMAVYAVSPGAATATKAARNAGPALKRLMVPLASLIPAMNQTPETTARR